MQQDVEADPMSEQQGVGAVETAKQDYLKVRGEISRLDQIIDGANRIIAVTGTNEWGPFAEMMAERLATIENEVVYGGKGAELSPHRLGMLQGSARTISDLLMMRERAIADRHHALESKDRLQSQAKRWEDAGIAED